MNVIFDAFKAPFDSTASANTSAGTVALVWGGTAFVLGMVLAK